MGRNDDERQVAFFRFASDLGLGNRQQVEQLLRDGGEPANYLIRRAEELCKRARDLPSGDDDCAYQWLNTLSDQSVELIELVEARGWSWCSLENDPFLFRTNEEWLERITGTARLLRRRLREPDGPQPPDPPPRRISVLEHQAFSIVAIVGKDAVSAWVGSRHYGAAVEFSRRTLRPTGEVDAPAFRTAAGLAIAWYVDISVPSLGQIPSVSLVASDKWIDMMDYRAATPGFDQDVTSFRDVHAAHAHWVVSHIRHLSVGMPSAQKIASAPPHLKSFMGDHDTWVEGHPRQGHSVDALLAVLRARTGLADAAGTAYWIT